MATEHAEWLSGERGLSLSELAERSGLADAEIRELVDFGAIAPVDPQAPQWVFSETCLVTARTACRLRAGLELEPHGVALVVSLLDRIRDLEAQLDRLRAQLPQQFR